MKKLHLKTVSIGNYSKDNKIRKRLVAFNNGLIELSETSIEITAKDGRRLTSSLTSAGSLTKESKVMSLGIFHGSYEDGTSFRLSRPTDWFKEIITERGQPQNITFGDMTGDGYAVTFDLVETTEPDIGDVPVNQGTGLISPSDSKAEQLVYAADAVENTDPNGAVGYIRRFLSLVQENEIEIVKFEHTQNIIYGFILAVRLSIIDEETANDILGELKLNYTSSNSIRYENGIHIMGSDSANRTRIEIAPNFITKEGYLVTIYGQEHGGNDSFSLSKIQMKSTHKSITEIVLKGFGYSDWGEPFEDYGLSIKLKENCIQEISFRPWDGRDIEIKYFND